MADEADRAAAMIEMEISAGIAAARPRGPGRDDCLECGEPIPARRRETLPSALRCVACQQAWEGRP